MGVGEIFLQIWDSMRRESPAVISAALLLTEGMNELHLRWMLCQHWQWYQVVNAGEDRLSPRTPQPSDPTEMRQVLWNDLTSAKVWHSEPRHSCHRVMGPSPTGKWGNGQRFSGKAEATQRTWQMTLQLLSYIHKTYLLRVLKNIFLFFVHLPFFNIGEWSDWDGFLLRNTTRLRERPVADNNLNLACKTS
jgi:hypothetical protein